MAQRGDLPGLRPQLRGLGRRRHGRPARRAQPTRVPQGTRRRRALVQPWYPSPLADGGYDVSDYRDIHPTFGTLEDAELLISEALELGIRTIIDIVPNHVSSEHPWFQQALAAGPGARARALLVPPGQARTATRCPRAGSRTSRATRGRAREPRRHAGGVVPAPLHPEQPDLNWNHPDVRAEHEDILRFWFDRGVAGVRIDSAGLLIKDPSCPRCPRSCSPAAAPHRGPRRGARRLPLVAAHRRLVRGGARARRRGVGARRQRFAAYLRPDEMHTAFNFDFMVPWMPRSSAPRST